MKPTNPNTPPSTCAEPKLAKTSPHVRMEVRLQVPAISVEAQLNNTHTGVSEDIAGTHEQTRGSEASAHEVDPRPQSDVAREQSSEPVREQKQAKTPSTPNVHHSRSRSTRACK